jgi:replication factor C subunit 3/5
VFGASLSINLFTPLIKDLPPLYTSRMSDYEDDMDVDEHPIKDTVIFSSENTKGKRSAANLPVEAEDSLPWYHFWPSPKYLLALHLQGRKVSA